MKGCFYWAAPKQRVNLVNDYRDPEIPDSCYANYCTQSRFNPLSAPKSNSECSTKTSSLKNAFSDTWVIDALKAANLKPKLRVTQDVKFINSKKEELLEQAFLLKKMTKKVTPNELKFMLQELQDEKFGLTFVFVKKICKMDRGFLSDLTEITGENPRSPMGTDYEQLSLFIEVMKEWETAFKRGDGNRSFSIILYLAMFYLKQDVSNLFWLVYQLFHVALALVANVEQREYCEAALRFIFGRFLLEKTKLYSEAEEHLRAAANLSKGRDSWSVTCITDTEDDYIYRRSVYLHHLLLIINANIASKSGDINKAVTLMEQSVLIVDLVGSDEAIAHAWLDLAVFYFQADLTMKAIVYALKALKFFTSAGQAGNMGVAMLYLGIFYKKVEYFEEAYKIFMELMKLAEDPSISCLQAEATNQMEAIEEISLNSLLKKKDINYGDYPCEPQLSPIRVDLLVYKKKAEQKLEAISTHPYGETKEEDEEEEFDEGNESGSPTMQ